MTELGKSFLDARSRRKWATASPKPLTIREVVAFLRKRMALILASGFVAAAISAWMVADATPVYEAGGQLLLGEQGRNTTSTELQQAQLLNNSVIEGELAILRSSTLLARVVERLELMETPQFNPALVTVEPPSALQVAISSGLDTVKSTIRGFLPAPAEVPKAVNTTSDAEQGLTPIQRAAMANPESQGELGHAIRELRGAIRVRQQGASFVVAVRATTSDPQISAAAVNTLMNEYIRFTSEKRFEAARQFASFLETRVEELGATLEASEREALAFRAVIESNADSSARLDQQMRELTTKLVDSRAEFAEAEARLVRVTDVRNSNGLLAAADVLNSDAILDLRTELTSLRNALASTIATSGSEAPQVSSLRRDLAETEATLQREAERTILELENLVETLNINVVALESSLRSLEGLILTRSNDLIRLNQLTKVAEANREIYQDFLGRYKQTVEIQNLQSEDAEVLSYASPPGFPSSPNKKVAVILALVGGLMAGLAIAFLLEMRARRLGSALELAETTGLLSLGSAPNLVRKIQARPLLRKLLHKPNSPTASAARLVMRNVDLQSAEGPRSVLVTGENRDRAKSNLALMLAQTAAASGRSCLLIDADTRNAALTKSLGMTKRVDLTNVIYDGEPVTYAIHKVQGYGFSFMPTSVIGADPALVFESARAEQVFKLATEAYDLVIIDAPPLTHNTEIFALPTSIDLGIVTAVSGKSRLSDLTDFMRLFGQLPLRSAGSVLIETRNRRAIG